MKTWMVPPHVRPTAKASSSAMPYVTSFGDPPSRTANASVSTAPSTHPPDTDPATSPSEFTAMAAPGSRGPDPSTATTRANATCLPAPRQRSMSSRTSLMTSTSRYDAEVVVEDALLVAHLVRRSGGDDFAENHHIDGGAKIHHE